MEFDNRPSPVRDAIAHTTDRWLTHLTHLAMDAVEAGDLPPDTGPAQIAFELNGIAMVANQASSSTTPPTTACAAAATEDRAKPTSSTS
ncbi:hypothetical protein KV205_35265 [Streptomyces sp. SKN60]|uniref:TetR family transcriptional regulator C-terminal domain-containing protein n=1 Tax=Streptomyces sp. SKN60 TaxID=2855506 RepID=UPI00224790B2|nr:hypothetical protein [Streptomyces sp. SKN60]MCX2185726.1 hypothetical protein [Streptomyces sp. SKN60]